MNGTARLILAMATLVVALSAGRHGSGGPLAADAYRADLDPGAQLVVTRHVSSYQALTGSPAPGIGVIQTSLFWPSARRTILRNVPPTPASTFQLGALTRAPPSA